MAATILPICWSDRAIASRYSTPIEPVEMLMKIPADELRIFHHSKYPGFLLWSLDDAEPSQLVYLDNRVELPTDEMWRTYDQVSRGEGWRETFDRYEVNAVVADVDGQSGLIEAMRGAEGWNLDFENEFYVLYTRGPHG